jgi:outer membrane receptor protein involved in Fe transport
VAGPKVAMDRNAGKFHFYPRMKLEINITDLLVPYIGLNGYYEDHTLRSVSRENPYIIHIIDIKPTSHRFIAYGGLRGRFSPMVAFNLAVSYEEADTMMFFIPDLTNPKLNTFNVVYDNAKILQMGGEVSLRQSENLSFILKGNYYQYTLRSLPAPWHKPGWDLNFTTRYAWKKKLMVKAELFMLGKYSVPDPDPSVTVPKELDGLIDINLTAEYRITPWMSVFAQVNNLISDKYYIWQNYPMQGINFIGGLSWIF